MVEDENIDGGLLDFSSRPSCSRRAVKRDGADSESGRGEFATASRIGT